MSVSNSDQVVRYKGFDVEIEGAEGGGDPDGDWNGNDDQGSKKKRKKTRRLAGVGTAIVYGLMLILIGVLIGAYSSGITDCALADGPLSVLGRLGDCVSRLTIPRLDTGSSDPITEEVVIKPVRTEMIDSGSFCDPAACGNGVCDAGCENATTCAVDCTTPAPDPCGNGVCDPGEHVYNCSVDCGEPPANNGSGCKCVFKCTVTDPKDKSVCLQGGGVDCNGNACTP